MGHTTGIIIMYLIRELRRTFDDHLGQLEKCGPQPTHRNTWMPLIRISGSVKEIWFTFTYHVMIIIETSSIKNNRVSAGKMLGTDVKIRRRRRSKTSRNSWQSVANLHGQLTEWWWQWIQCRVCVCLLLQRISRLMEFQSLRDWLDNYLPSVHGRWTKRLTHSLTDGRTTLLNCLWEIFSEQEKVSYACVRH